VPGQPDLFTQSAEEELARRSPLAERLRPKTIDDIVGQQHLLGPGMPLRQMIEQDRLHSIILWGPPGSGKTTIGRVIATTTSSEFVMLHATTAGVKDLREVVAAAEERLATQQKGTIVYIDEVHRWNKGQLDALLGPTESGIITLVGATTETPYFEINPALLSRSTIYRLEPLGPDSITKVIRRALHVLGGTITDEARDQIVQMSSGDARQAIGLLELVWVTAVGRSGNGPLSIGPEDVERSGITKVYRYDTDEHYSMARALIHSLQRDPQAAAYWAGRMMLSGDPNFLMRRLLIFASEECGLADSNALCVMAAASQAIQFVGLPEAKIILMHAVLYLANAPKSNSVVRTLGRVNDTLAHSPVYPVPAVLGVVDTSNTHQEALPSRLQMHPHEHAEENRQGEMLPPELAGSVFYEPSANDRVDRHPNN